MVCLSPDGRARKSKLAERFALRSADEAAAYLEHAVLGPRLLRCVEAVLALQVVATDAIFGYPDDLKFKSSMTLFATISENGSPFHQILDYGGDPKILNLLNASREFGIGQS